MAQLPSARYAPPPPFADLPDLPDLPDLREGWESWEGRDVRFDREGQRTRGT